MAMSKRRRTNKEVDQVNYLPTKGLLQEGSKMVISFNLLELRNFSFIYLIILFSSIVTTTKDLNSNFPNKGKHAMPLKLLLIPWFGIFGKKEKTIFSLNHKTA